MNEQLLNIFGSKEFLKKEYPSLATLLCRSTNGTGEADNFSQKGLLDCYTEINRAANGETEGGALLRANFLTHQPAIIISGEIWDETRNICLETFRTDAYDVASLNLQVKLGDKAKSIAQDHPLITKANFCWLGADGEMHSTSRIRRSDSGTNIFDVEVTQPRARDKKTTIVLYARTPCRQEVVDYSYGDLVRTSGENKIVVFLPFAGKVQVSKEWRVLSIAQKDPFSPDLKILLNTGGFVTYSQDFVSKFTISDNLVSWGFSGPYDAPDHKWNPDCDQNWKAKLDLALFSVKTIVDFHCHFYIYLQNVANPQFCTYEPVVINSMPMPSANNSSEFIEQISIRWGCMGKHTRITMDDGSIRAVSEIRVGDYVSTSEGKQGAVEDIMTGYEEDLVYIQTQDGCDILLTEDHPIKTQNRGFVRAGELNPGDMLDTVDGSKAITSLFLRSYQDQVFNLCLRESVALLGNGFIIGDFNMQNSSPANSVRSFDYSPEVLQLLADLKRLMEDKRISGKS